MDTVFSGISHMTSASPRSEGTLVRALGPITLAAAIANVTIGGGIFRLPAAVAASLGAAAPLAYLVCAVAMGLIVLCIAEAGSRVTLTGGPYAYVELAFGPYIGFLAGVMLWLLGTTAVAAVSGVFADNVAALIPAFASPLLRALVLITAFALTGGVNIIGVRYGSRLNTIATAAKLAPLLLLVAVGVFFIKGENLAIAEVPSAGTLTRTSILLIFAFSGIESALVPSGEVRDPARTVPRAIFTAMIGITLLYVVLQLVAQGVLGAALGSSTTPLADAAGQVFGPWGRTMLLVGVVVSTFGYLSGMTLAVPRALYAFARDGFVPAPIARIHPTWNTPYIAIIVQVTITCALAVTSSFGPLAIIANVAALLVYFSCAAAAWELRRRNVQSGGTPFRVPGAALVPILACVVIIGLLTSITWAEWRVLMAVLAVATVLFFLRRKPAVAAAALCLVLGAVGAPSLSAQPATALRQGFSVARLARIDSLLEQTVRDQRITGAVALVLRDDAVVYERAFGWADKEAGRRMTTNALFRIASQTKALTSTAALMLVEEGRLSLADPVSRFIPTFQRTTVAVRTDTRVDTGVALVPAKRAITVRDLLTHTAGISYGVEATVAARYQAKGLGPAAGFGWYTADKDEGVCETMERLGTLPFVSQPGEAFVYGYNTDILGCIVEKVSGQPLDAFVRTRVTAPLGMTSTFFFVPPTDRDRLAAVYRSDSAGLSVRAPDGARGQGHYVDGPRRNFAGGAGLVSSARDYARFLQMIAHHGAWNGQQFLAPHTVRLMRTNQIGTTYSSAGMGFGLGFETTDRYGANGMASEGSFGWGGAYGSTYLVDPKEGLILVFMMQQTPNASDVAARYRTLVYQALVTSRAN